MVGVDVLASSPLFGPVIAGEVAGSCNWVVLGTGLQRTLFLLLTDGCENYTAQGATSGCKTEPGPPPGGSEGWILFVF